MNERCEYLRIICDKIASELQVAGENIIDVDVQPEGGRIVFGPDDHRDDNPYFTISIDNTQAVVELWIWHPIKENMSQRGSSTVRSLAAANEAMELYSDWFV